MENESVEVSHDADENSTRKEATESNHNGAKYVPIPSSPGNNKNFKMVNWKSGEIVSYNVPADEDSSAEVNMEASITTDDVVRAGGFGARDDIGSFLPVASDSTDFEATILDARHYEEPQEKICRPGLGWRESTEEK